MPTVRRAEWLQHTARSITAMDGCFVLNVEEDGRVLADEIIEPIGSIHEAFLV